MAGGLRGKKRYAVPAALATVIALCAIYMLVAWWVSDRGPGGVHLYPVRGVSFEEIPPTEVGEDPTYRLSVSLGRYPTSFQRTGTEAAILKVQGLKLQIPPQDEIPTTQGSGSLTKDDLLVVQSHIGGLLLATKMHDWVDSTLTLRFPLTKDVFPDGWPFLKDDQGDFAPWSVDVEPPGLGFFRKKEGAIRLDFFEDPAAAETAPP